jgi:hypothetical protein
MTTEFRRLGKPGAYRLGQLRAKGVAEQGRPRQFRPRFGQPRQHWWPAWVWLLGLAAGVAVIAAATRVGWWFVPYVAGVGAGIATRWGDWAPRVVMPAVAGMAVVGWGLPVLLWPLRGEPYGAVARLIATLTGWPAYSAAGILLTFLIAALLAITGYLLGSVLTPRLPDEQLRRG